MSSEDIKNVRLKRPVDIDGKPVCEIAVREPTAGELRGLAVSAIMSMEVSAMIRLLPRITMPPLSEAQVAAMRPGDFGQLAGTAAGFFFDVAEADQTTSASPTG